MTKWFISLHTVSKHKIEISNFIDSTYVDSFIGDILVPTLPNSQFRRVDVGAIKCIRILRFQFVRHYDVGVAFVQSHELYGKQSVDCCQ